jgi:steroid 5-alpha reductase family enzyme
LTWQIFGTTGLVILGLVSAVWLLSLLLRDSSIIDVFWGLGFVLACWIYFAATPDGYLPRKGLLTLLVTLWGLRLSLYILIRNWKRGEDYRYRQWRQAAGRSWWWRSYFKVFLLQGALLWLISTPLLAAQLSPSPARLTVLDILAVLVWGIGFFFETAGDWQLARFKADPGNRGRLLTSGIWRYTRHPNYFGDAAQWWGFYLFALATGGWWTIFSPLLVTVLLVKVSGAARLEKSLAENKPGYREYMERTSAFIPWAPRRR